MRDNNIFPQGIQPLQHADSRSHVSAAIAAAERKGASRLPIYVPSAETMAILANLAESDPSVATHAQRRRTLAALQRCVGGCTARDLHGPADIGDPRRRVKDLIDEEGHRIVSEWVLQSSATGTYHRTKLYRLVEDAVGECN